MCDALHELFNKICIRLQAEKGPAPSPLGNFADIFSRVENFKQHQLRDVVLCAPGL